jgi:hypothetical protein
MCSLYCHNFIVAKIIFFLNKWWLREFWVFFGGGFESLSHRCDRTKIEQVSNIETFTISERWLREPQPPA